jgi:hypothetical protein
MSSATCSSGRTGIAAVDVVVRAGASVVVVDGGAELVVEDETVELTVEGGVVDVGSGRGVVVAGGIVVTIAVVVEARGRLVVEGMEVVGWGLSGSGAISRGAVA